jgi:predicted negative regulator of RcsB-dependent stress response
MRLHEANVLLKQERYDHARAILDTVSDPALLAQKEKLVAQLPKAVEK